MRARLIIIKCGRGGRLVDILLEAAHRLILPAQPDESAGDGEGEEDDGRRKNVETDGGASAEERHHHVVAARHCNDGNGFPVIYFSIEFNV